MSWDKYIEEYISVNPQLEKDLIRAVKCIKNYTDKSMWEIKRSDIYNLNQNCFRQYLSDNIKSDSGKNTILRALDRFYQYWIIDMKCNDSNFNFVNPFDFKFDKFKIMVKYSTYREVIPLEVINLMKEILIKDDFKFSKRFSKENWSPSESSLLYTLLTIPLRGIQAQLLDSGLRDEFSYDFESRTMHRNLSGIKGRKEGFIQMSHYSSWSKEARESLWITTNKSMQCGYEINWVDEGLLKVIEKQIEFLRKCDNGEGLSDRFHYLFRDVHSNEPVSKVKIYKLWKKLCVEVQGLTGIKLIHNKKCIFTLHNIRVSLISHWLDKGANLKVISKNITGHASESMTLYYYRSQNLKDKLKLEESKIAMIDSLKLLGVKNESK